MIKLLHQLIIHPYPAAITFYVFPFTLYSSPRRGSAHSVPWGPTQADNKIQSELPPKTWSGYQALTNTIFFFIPNGQGMVYVQPYT